MVRQAHHERNLLAIVVPLTPSPSPSRGEGSKPSHLKNNVANPSSDAKPMQSVKVVRITPLASAGSTRMLFNINGTMTPTKAAANKLVNIARKIITAISTVLKNINAYKPTTVAHSKPLSKATVASFNNNQRELSQLI